MISEGVRVRILTLASSLISLLANLAYSLLITRKLATFSLGVLNIVNGAVVTSLVLQSIVSFTASRSTARDGSPSVYMFILYLSMGVVGSALAMAYIYGVSWRFREIYLEVMVFTFLISLSSFLQGYVNTVLTVVNRVSLQYAGIVSSIVKLVSIVYIMESGWSLFSVLVSSILISLSYALYGLAYIATRLTKTGGLSRYFREMAHSSWIPLLGYGAGNLKSIDSMIIGYLGGIVDNAMWQILNVQGKAIGLASGIINVSYGELLTGKSLERRFYIDLLAILSITTALSIFVVVYEPYIVYFLRPQEYSFIPALAAPTILLAILSIVSIVNQYISWVMQGVDRVDFRGEVTYRTYVGSLVFHAHFAEFILAVAYVALIYPMILVAKALGSPSPVILGVLAASILANVVSLIYRYVHFRVKGYGLPINYAHMLRDYAAPTALSILVVLLEAVEMLKLLPPTKGAVAELARIALAAAVSLATYVSLAVAISRNVRSIVVGIARALYLRFMPTARP